MATLNAGIIGGKSRSPWTPIKTPSRVTVCRASYSSSVADPYRTLSIERGASETEIKKAFRKLVLKYHPDVCKERNSKAKFEMIYEAYDTVMTHLREEQEKAKEKRYAYDPEDLWEEWMGWEGAGIRDYSSHINPYI